MAVIDTWFQFATMLLFNLGLATILVVIFSLLHGMEWFRRLFASRMFLEEPGAPAKPVRWPFEWLKPVWMTTEQDIITMSGLDAAVYLRMFTVSIQVCEWKTVTGGHIHIFSTFEYPVSLYLASTFCLHS